MSEVHISPLLRFAAGERAAFDDLVRDYASPAYGVALKVLHDPALAEEAVQESFLRIWRNASRFEGARGSERTWILSVVRNQSIDMLRRRARHPETPLDAAPAALALRDPQEPWSALAANLRAAELRQGLAQLPAEQRGVIELAFFGDMRSVDIARRLRLPEGTVRSRMRLGLAKLRGLLAEGPPPVAA